jgi:hypothetical protein
MNIGGQATGMGLGMMGGAIYNAEQAIGAAQRTGSLGNPDAMSFLQNAQAGISAMGTNANGVTGLAKVRAIKDLEKEYGVRLNETDVMKLQTLNASPEDLEKMMRDRGYSGPATGKNMYAKMDSKFKESLVDLYGTQMGDKEQGKLMLAKELGARSFQDVEKVNSLLEMGLTPQEIQTVMQESSSPLGQKEAENQTSFSAAKAADGLSELSKVLPIVNKSFEEMIENFKKQKEEVVQAENLRSALSAPGVAGYMSRRVHNAFGPVGDYALKKVLPNSTPKK